MEEALTAGIYAPYYCAEHGKHFLVPGKRPNCPVCDVPCFTPMEWQYRTNPRIQRERRVQLLRNHLE